MQRDTIAAIATPLGTGGIGVIRLSGPEAVTVAARIFQRLGNKNVEKMKGYTAAFGRIHDGESVVDEAVLTVFRAPKSYTGEDVAELSCHGGVYILRRALRACLSAGARPAQPGEFTRRAFLAGKLSLTQAEAVIDLISADGEQAMQAALTARDGALSRAAEQAAEELLAHSAHIAAWSDYPEEDLVPLDPAGLRRGIADAAGRLERLLLTYESGRVLRDGVETAIIGRPNVGKSALMNLLSGVDRSIVTELPGTTRDVVEERVRVGGVTLVLADTAGIRDTEDPVEKIGVELARKRLASCRLILLVFDASRPLTGEDEALLELVKGRRVIAVVNKVDLDVRLDIGALRGRVSALAEISARTGEGAEDLAAAIIRVLELGNIDTSAAMVVNERQRDCISGALSELREALAALEAGFPPDAAAVCLEAALDQLLSLTGRRTPEAVVDQVFSRFCVGK